MTARGEEIVSQMVNIAVQDGWEVRSLSIRRVEDGILREYQQVGEVMPFSCGAPKTKETDNG